jgi:predicted nucleotidyltransferase
MDDGAVRRRFTTALEALVAHAKADRSVLAAILCGSLSHDTVWEKSDIDLLFVTVDDKKIDASDVPLYADGTNVHAFLVPRAQFRRIVEGSLHNSFVHALLAKGRLLYTHDETIAELCGRLQDIGARDTQIQLLRAATHVLPPMYKARKWLVTRGDVHYTALWILYTATPLAQVEVIGRRLIADREVIPQAAALNPALFTIIYTDLLETKKTPERVRAALETIERYMAERARSLFAPVLDYLHEAGEARSSREIESHFARTLDVAGVTTACEYLADQAIIGKASTPVRLTTKSNVQLQELAFFYSESLKSEV